MAPLSHATITGDRRVTRLLEEMADRASGVEDAWPRVGDVIAGAMREQFRTEGAHLNGKQWAPLSPKYLAWKLRKNLRPERLRATDNMRISLTSRPLMAVEEYRRMSATFGTDDKKAGFHQHGTSLMPQRRIINVTDDLADDVNSVLARYIFENRLG